MITISSISFEYAIKVVAAVGLTWLPVPAVCEKVYHTCWCKQNSMDKDLKVIHACQISKFCNGYLKCMQSHKNKLFSR